MKAEVNRLLQQVRADVHARTPPQPMATRIVAVDGPGAAGKSTFAALLSAALDGCPVVHTDDFASWDNPVDWWPDLITTVLDPLASGKRVRFQPSSWGPGHHPDPVEIAPAQIVVIEGVTASRAAFRPYLTYSIWIDASAEVRLERGLARDGKPSEEQWRAWMREEDAYKARERPHELADLVLDGERDLWS